MIVILKRTFFMSVIISLAVTGFIVQYANTVKADIENSVVRLHVVANGNSFEEQQLKLKVRDDVIKTLSPYLSGVKNKNNAEYIIKSHLEDVEKTAKKTLLKNGSDCDVKVYFEKHDFPTKRYADISFPKGKYKALRVVIGGGRGENWWCVLFPQLCFTEDTYGKLTADGKERLENTLSEDEYEILLNDTKIKFRVLEFIDKLRQ